MNFFCSNQKIVTVTVLIKTWIDFKPEMYLDYEYEAPVQFLGWVLELYPVAVVILIGAWNAWKSKKNGNSAAFFRVGPMLQPKSTWGPRPDRDYEDNDKSLDLKISQQCQDNLAFD